MMKLLRKWLSELIAPKKVIISFREGMNLTELPIITLWQGTKRFNFILDTGSNDSMINKGILNDIEYKILNRRTSTIGLEGIEKDSPMCSITLSYKSTDYTYDYVIADLKKVFEALKKESGVTLHGIIGSKFFNQFKYILDFDELIAYSKV